MSLHIEFPEFYVQCGTCAGTGTITEANMYGTPIRKQCRKCLGQGSIRKSSYHSFRAHDAIDEDQSLDQEAEHADDAGSGDVEQGPLIEHERVRSEIEMAQAVLEDQLMRSEGLTYDHKLALWARLHAVTHEVPGSEDALEALITEFIELGMHEFAHELTMLAIAYSQITALKLRLKMR